MRNVEESDSAAFADLLMYYNQSLFPGLYPCADEEEIEDDDGAFPHPEVGMTQSDAAFIEKL